MGDTSLGTGNGRPDRGSIRRMFARIAPRYDLLNHLLSAGIDAWWRRKAVEAALRGHPRKEGVRVLDTCAGTGDLAIAFARELTPRGRVLGCDYTPEMLALFAKKALEVEVAPRLGIAAGDSLALPFRDDAFHVVSAAFGVRNVAVGAPGPPREGLVETFREMARVLRPGGRVVILEFSTPRGGWVGPALRLYFRRVLPTLGNFIFGKGETAYDYLPWSLDGFPEGSEFLKLLERAGLHPVAARPLTAGMVTLYLAEKRAAPRGGPAPTCKKGGSRGLR